MVWSPLTLRQKSEHAIADLPALTHAAQEIASHILQGVHGQRKSGGHEKFWQFREFNEVDRPQDIDWRQSAKTDHIFVREKELQTPQSVYFWCHSGASMDFKSSHALYSKRESAQILSLALALLFQRGDERIGVLGQSRAGIGGTAVDHLGRHLLEAHNDEDVLPHGIAPSKSALVFCGDFLEPIDATAQAFEDFTNRKTRGILLQILDPAELTLPYHGHVVFEDGKSARTKVDQVSSIREAYTARISGHNAALAALCDAHGWRYHLHVTDKPLEESLRILWEGEQR